MLFLGLAVFALLFAFYRLLQPRSKSPTGLPGLSTSKPSFLEKLLSEAFEHLSSSSTSPRVLVLYATEYGFAKEVAAKLASHLSSAGFAPRVVSTLHYRLLDFTKEPFIALVCSTTGDGAPPNEAADLRDALVARDVVLPHHSNFAVLALGDRAYPHFCRAGLVFDELLGDKGRMMHRVDIDQEDWPVIDEWIDSFQAAVSERVRLREEHEQEDDYLRAAMTKYAEAMENRVDARYTRNEPFMARLVSRELLTAPQSGREGEKEVIRVEFDIEGSGMQYEVGDAVGVVPRNNSAHVTRLLLGMASNGDEMVRLSEKSEPVMFEDALTEQLDIRTAKPELVLALAENSTDRSEVALAERILGYDITDVDVVTHNAASVSEWGKGYLQEREVFDILSDFVSATISPQELTDLLRPLHARYYSISSTPVLTPDRIAATVDVLRYSSLKVEREGVASTFLKDRCMVDETKVGIFISKNPNFRLPKDGAKHVIMIGPGTGIAPFIAFIEERIETKADGKNWLFFGCRHEKQDFLYADRLKELVESEHLKVDTAFSRDTLKKVYVQHRMKENAKELWDLVEDGAHLYVCGDGGKMADDVDSALRRIIQEHGSMSEDEAKSYVEELSESKRYQRDVWVS